MAGGEERASNFEFALNSETFSDRILRIEVAARDSAAWSGGDNGGGSPPDSPRSVFPTGLSGDVEGGTAADSAPPRKRCRREEIGDVTGTPVLRVMHIHVSSVILASKSPFFYKLFANGMQESTLKEVTLRIMDHEEDALAKLLNFIYSGRLDTSDPVLLLQVMLVADQFEVIDCMVYSSQQLVKLPMTMELALLYLDYDCSAPMSTALQPLKTAAEEFLADKYRNLLVSKGEIMNMPLCGIKAIFSSSVLQVPSEDFVLDFLIKWVYAKYAEKEERHQILSQHLLPLVRFSQMSVGKLQWFLAFQDLDSHQSAKTVICALLYKFNPSHREHLAAIDPPWRHLEREYRYRPIKSINFEQPYKQCIAYLDLKQEKCADLFPSGNIRSEPFYFAGYWFFLVAACNMVAHLGIHCLGLFLGVERSGPVPVTAEIEFAARAKPTGDFLFRFKISKTFTGDGSQPVGHRNVLNLPWDEFVAADTSPFMVNGILHLRAQLTARSTTKIY